MAISKSAIITELLNECPELQEEWGKYERWMKKAEKTRDIEIDVGTAALLLTMSYKAGQTSFFPRCFAFIERIFCDGEPDARKMIVEKFLKGLRVSSVTKQHGRQAFESWMGVKTKRHWHEILEKAASAPSLLNRLRRQNPENLREYVVALTECPSRQSTIPSDGQESTRGTATKLGGEPNWLQGDERPQCPHCKQSMVFVAQIDSIEHRTESNPHSKPIEHQHWMFGDAGMIYVFFCFSCEETRSVFQGH
jgi:hypothetical protein